MRLSALIPAGFLAGAALCAWMLKSAPAAIAVDRAQPLAVVTYWQQFGAQMWIALALAIAIASVGYVLVMVSLSNHGGRNEASTNSAALRYLRVTLFTSALACAAALLFPVVFSSDVYAYAGYGDMALHGISPYAHARIGVRDPLLDAMLWQWGNPPPMCVYGPAFVWLAQAIVAVFMPLGAAAPLSALRALACIALVACAPLAYAAFSAFPRSTRLAAAAGIALNPVAIWSAAEGHNDALALAIVLAGFALAARSRVFFGAFVAALAALVKAPGAVAAAALALASWSDRSRFARAASGAAAGIALVAALAIPLEYGVRSNLAPQGHYFPQFSLQYVSVWLAVVVIGVLVVASTSSAVLRYLRMTRGANAPLRPLRVFAAAPLRVFAGAPLRVFAGAPLRVFAGAPLRVFAGAPLRVFAGAPLRVFAGAPLLVFAAWVGVPNPYPWYAIWLLPVAFLVWRSYAAWALIAASLLIAVRYYPDATTDLSRPLSIVIVAIEFGVPLVLLIAHMASLRRARREIHTPVPDFAASRTT
jgi:hypothetical protein